jgi:hypothetical protein
MTDPADHVWADFNARLADATGVLLHGRIALTVHRNRIANNIARVGANPATPIETSSGPIPGHPGGISLQVWDQTALTDALDDRGVAFRQLGHQWVVFVFQSVFEKDRRACVIAVPAWSTVAGWKTGHRSTRRIPAMSSGRSSSRCCRR